MLVLFSSVLVSCFSGQAYHESNCFCQVRTFGLYFSSLSFVKPVVNISAIIISYSPPPPISDLWNLGNATLIWVYASTSQDCILGKLCMYHPLPSSQSSKVLAVRNYMHAGQEDVLQRIWKILGARIASYAVEDTCTEIWVYAVPLS